MKIIHVHHHYWPVIGGLENVVKSLAEEQARLGHEVHVVVSSYGAEDRPREECVNDVYVHRVKSFRLFGYPDLTHPLDYPNILKNADIVHGHSQNSLFTMKTLEHVKGLGVKTAIHFMAVDALYDHPNPIVRILGSMYSKRSTVKAIEIADIKMVRSLRDAEILRSRYNASDLHYVPDGVKEYLLKAPDMSQVFRDKYQVYDPFIVYVGRLHPLKGVEVLIKAMALVTKEMKEARTVMVGPGDQRPYKQLAAKLGLNKSVVFTGYVDEDMKIAAIDSSNALALPSISNYVEVYPMVVSEAWARGKPVIASAVGGLPYRVRDMVNGILVQPRNPEALANAIIMLLSDKELAKKLGERGRGEVKTWEEIAREVLKLYVK